MVNIITLGSLLVSKCHATTTTSIAAHRQIVSHIVVIDSHTQYSFSYFRLAERGTDCYGTVLVHLPHSYGTQFLKGKSAVTVAQPEEHLSENV